jgi:hypothetical protein
VARPAKFAKAPEQADFQAKYIDLTKIDEIQKQQSNVMHHSLVRNLLLYALKHLEGQLIAGTTMERKEGMKWGSLPSALLVDQRDRWVLAS